MPFDRRQSIRASAVLAVCLLATPGLARDRGAPNRAGDARRAFPGFGERPRRRGGALARLRPT